MIIQKQKRYNRVKIVILWKDSQIYSLFLEVCQGKIDVGRIIMEAKDMQVILESLAAHVLSLLIHTQRRLYAQAFHIIFQVLNYLPILAEEVKLRVLVA